LGTSGRERLARHASHAAVLTIGSQQRKKVGPVDGLVVEEGVDDPIELGAVRPQQLGGALLSPAEKPRYFLVDDLLRGFRVGRTRETIGADRARRGVGEADRAQPLREPPVAHHLGREVGRAGKVFNILKAQSLNPSALRASMDLYLAVMHGPAGLSRVEREMLATVVSWANHCFY